MATASGRWLGTLDLKEARGQSRGNSLREAVPLRDGAGEEGLLSILGSVGWHIKGAGVGLEVALLWAACSWHVLESVFNRLCNLLLPEASGSSV